MFEVLLTELAVLTMTTNLPPCFIASYVERGVSDTSLPFCGRTDNPSSPKHTDQGKKPLLSSTTVGGQRESGIAGTAYEIRAM